MNKYGVIFDFNGTMFFDGEIQEKSWRIFLDHKIGRMISDEEFQKYVHGCHADLSLAYFLNRSLSREEIEQLSEEKEEVYRRLCLQNREGFKLAEGLVEFLDDLKERKIPFTIATASGLNNLKFFFEYLQLDSWFEFDQVVYDDGFIPSKPDPFIYLKAAENIGILPENCIVFEDAVSGLEAASRAGIGRIIGVSSSMTREQLLQVPGVSETIADYTKLIHLLD